MPEVGLRPEAGLFWGLLPGPEVPGRHVGGGASLGGLGRACRISQGCSQGWAFRPGMPPCAVIQVHVLTGVWSGRACRPVLAPGKAVHQAHHPCYEIRHAGQLSAMQVLTPSAACQSGHACEPCSPVGAPYSPSPCAKQPFRPTLPPRAATKMHHSPPGPRGHTRCHCCHNAIPQRHKIPQNHTVQPGSNGLPTSALGTLAAGAGATGRQLSRNLGTSLLNQDFLPDLREQRASVAEAECSTLADSRFRGCLALLVEAAAATMPPWPCSATAAHFRKVRNQCRSLPAASMLAQACSIWVPCAVAACIDLTETQHTCIGRQDMGAALRLWPCSTRMSKLHCERHWTPCNTDSLENV